jgi:uncharacterized protein YycO
VRTIRPGDYGVCRIHGLIGFLIRVAQWLNGNGFRNYEHAFLVLDDQTVIEAEPGGARITPLGYYLDAPAGSVAWSTVELTDEQRAAIVAAGRSYEHTPYSYLEYPAIAARRLHLPFGRLLRRYANSTRHLICSQLVAMAYAAAGVHLGDEDPGNTTPADLANLITP